MSLRPTLRDTPMGLGAPQGIGLYIVIVFLIHYISFLSILPLFLNFLQVFSVFLSTLLLFPLLF